MMDTVYVIQDQTNWDVLSIIAPVVLSITLIVITFWYAKTTKKILNTNLTLVNEQKAMVDAMRLQIKEQNRPNVVVYFPLEDGFIKIVIKNIGLRFAKNVSIKYENVEQIKALTHGFKDAVLGIDEEHSILSSLAPSQEIVDLVNWSETVVTELKEKIKNIKIIVKYEDEKGQSYEIDYYLPLKSYIFPKIVRIFSIQHHLNEISKHLSKNNGLLGTMNKISGEISKVSRLLENNIDKFRDDKKQQ